MTTPVPRHRATCRRALRDDAGATAVEYGLLVALIAVAILATVTMLGQSLGGSYATVSGAVAGTAEEGGVGQGNNGGGGGGTGGGGNGQGNNGNGNGNGGPNGGFGGGNGGGGGNG